MAYIDVIIVASVAPHHSCHFARAQRKFWLVKRSNISLYTWLMDTQKVLLKTVSKKNLKVCLARVQKHSLHYLRTINEEYTLI